jgi:hypothetical protein
MISWRDVLKVHPAAELFPLMSPDELLELGDDIRAHGLHADIALWTASIEDEKAETYLLDGRNRLDAMEAVGLLQIRKGDDWGKLAEGLKHATIIDGKAEGIDPYAYVISANIHRRHLTAERKRELIAKLIKQQPQKSSRQIAKMVGSSTTTATKVREDLVEKGDVSKMDASIVDTKGRKQPAKKRRTEIAKDIAAGVAGTQAQPSNRITAAWDEASDAQRLEFVRDRAEHLERVAGAGSRVRFRKQSTDNKEEAFTEWYRLFPRRVKPRAALKAYKQALSRGATVEDLKLGAKRYAAERDGQDPTFTMHPSTWLNGDCWKDEPRPQIMGASHAAGEVRAHSAARPGAAASSPLAAAMGDALSKRRDSRFFTPDDPAASGFERRAAGGRRGSG